MIRKHFEEHILELENKKLPVTKVKELSWQFCLWLFKKEPELCKWYIVNRGVLRSITKDGFEPKQQFGMWRNLLHDGEYKETREERLIIQIRKLWKEFKGLKTPYILDPTKYEDEPSIHRMIAS